MRILLINPFLPFERLKAIIHPTLAFGYLTPILRMASHEVKVLDLLISENPMQDLEVCFNQFQPDFVGLHSHTQTYCTAIEIASWIKNVRESCVVGLGGPHATLDPLGVLDRQRCFDFVFRFDSEQSLIEVLHLLAAGVQIGAPAMENICGIGFRRNKKLILTELERIRLDFSRMPTCDRSVFDMNWYKKNDPETVLMTARGCPGSCSFCATRVIGRKYRVHSFNNVLAEIGDIQEYGFESFFIGDDTFACNTKRTIEFCSEYVRRGFKMRWTSNLRLVDATPERLKAMKAAGAYRVFMGFETFNATNINSYNKAAINFERAKHTCELIRSFGLEIHGSFMVGGPADTKQSLLSSISLIKQLGLTVVTFNKIFAWPGTSLGQAPEAAGVYYTEDAFWFERRGWVERHPFYTNHLSPDDLKDVTSELYYELLS